MTTAEYAAYMQGRKGATPERICLTLPYPPTVNTYYRHVNGKTLISRDGREYRQQVQRIYTGGAMQGRIWLSIRTHAPDKRRRDLDNLCKSALDAMQHAGVYGDDSQINELHIQRGAVSPAEPRIVVTVLRISDGKGQGK